MSYFQVIFNSLTVASSNNLPCKVIVKFKLSFDKRKGLFMYIFSFDRKQDSKRSFTQAIFNMWPPKSLRIEKDKNCAWESYGPDVQKGTSVVHILLVRMNHKAHRGKRC